MAANLPDFLESRNDRGRIDVFAKEAELHKVISHTLVVFIHSVNHSVDEGLAPRAMKIRDRLRKDVLREVEQGWGNSIGEEKGEQ